MKALIAFALLLAVSHVSAQQRREPTEKNMVLIGAAEKHVEVQPDNIPLAEIRGRRLMSQPRRALKGTDGATTTSRLVVLQKQCPAAATETPFDQILYSGTQETLGDLVVDNGICYTDVGNGNVVTDGAASGATYGGSAQDFGALKPAWETYAWSLFYVGSAPESVTANTGATNLTRIQGINMQILGNVGLSSAAISGSCSLDAIDIGIFDAAQSGNYDVSSSTPVYNAKVLLTGANQTQFTWSTNQSTTLYTDIVDITTRPEGVELVPDKYYWLRVKLFTDYTAAKRCFVFWGMSSTPHAVSTIKSRWQERGGAAGYSTSCSGAGSSPSGLPGTDQTFWNCWNNGVSTALTNPLKRRCQTYRSQVNPALASSDCLGANGARFNDFNYGFVGFQGQTGAAAGGR